jgi:hypothetical protein
MMTPGQILANYERKLAKVLAGEIPNCGLHREEFLRERIAYWRERQ